VKIKRKERDNTKKIRRLSIYERNICINYNNCKRKDKATDKKEMKKWWKQKK